MDVKADGGLPGPEPTSGSTATTGGRRRADQAAGVTTVTGSVANVCPAGATVVTWAA